MSNDWKPAKDLPNEPIMIWWWEPGLEKPYFVALVSGRPKPGEETTWKYRYHTSKTGWWMPFITPDPPEVK